MGEVFLNMTDSIIYNGKVTLPVFSEKKILGKFEASYLIRKCYYIRCWKI